MEPIITRKISSLYAAYTPEWDVVSYGTCRDEALNNLTTELAARAGQEGRQAREASHAP